MAEELRMWRILFSTIKWMWDPGWKACGARAGPAGVCPLSCCRLCCHCCCHSLHRSGFESRSPGEHSPWSASVLLSESRGREAQDADLRGQLLSGCWSEQASSSHPGQAQPEGSGTEVCVCPAQQGGARGQAAGGLGLINTTLFGVCQVCSPPRPWADRKGSRQD